jgi:hypothetical protein
MFTDLSDDPVSVITNVCEIDLENVDNKFIVDFIGYETRRVSVPLVDKELCYNQTTGSVYYNIGVYNLLDLNCVLILNNVGFPLSVKCYICKETNSQPRESICVLYCYNHIGPRDSVKLNINNISSIMKFKEYSWTDPNLGESLWLTFDFSDRVNQPYWGYFGYGSKIILEYKIGFSILVI